MKKEYMAPSFEKMEYLPEENLADLSGVGMWDGDTLPTDQEDFV